MPTLWMVGHSDRTFPVFLELLQAHRIAHLVDIRAYPASRRHPQFDRLELEHRLPANGVHYSWMPHLGGMRTPVAASSLNGSWKEDGFRAYADHMQTQAFQFAWLQLTRVATSQRTGAMCAEANHLHCHRQLLADAFVARQWAVQHIQGKDKCVVHTLTPTAQIGDGVPVTYPEAPRLF
jgi:uncharacterized protein (DUF488 family)